MAHHDLRMPISEAQARALRVNDTVTIEVTTIVTPSRIRRNSSAARQEVSGPPLFWGADA